MADYDLVIRNAKIVDGTGAPTFDGSVGVKDGRIAYVGPDSIDGDKDIDAAGRYVTPGFIDMHTHYDAQITWDPWVKPHTKHGVTTYVAGNCGFALSPVTKESLANLIPMLAKVEGIPHQSLIHGANINWHTTGEMLDYLETKKVGVNIGFMTGHSTLRAYVMGHNAVSDTITRDEIDQMRKLLHQSLQEGALGFSSSHIETHKDHEGEDVPSLHASHEELLELMSIVREYEGTMTGYVLTGGKLTDEHRRKMAEVSLASNRTYAWPLLTPGYTGPEVAENKMSATDTAREMGAELRVQSPSYPLRSYINMKSGLSYDQFPGIWNSVYRGTHEQRVAKFADPALRAQLEADAEKVPDGDNTKFMAKWHTFTINSVKSPKNQKYVGRNVAEIAKEEGKTPFNALMDIVVEDDLETIVVPVDPNRDEKALWSFLVDCMRDDRTMWGGDDGGAHLDQLEAYCHGTHFLANAVRDYGLITIEETVHQFTQAIAQFIGLKDRGAIKIGMHADLLVLDLERLEAKPVELRADFPAGGERLYTDAEGFDYVIVNGVPIIADGEYTDALPGTVMRARRDTYTVDMTQHQALTESEYLLAAE